MATSVDLLAGVRVPHDYRHLKLRAPPKQDTCQPHSESAHATTTTLTIARIIVIRQTDNLDINRYQEPSNQNLADLNRQSVVLVPFGGSRPGAKARRDRKQQDLKSCCILLPTTPHQRSIVKQLRLIPHREAAPRSSETKQVNVAYGAVYQLKQTIFDTVQTTVSIGKNLGRLRQPSFFIYTK